MISDVLDRCYAASGWVSKSPFDDWWFTPRGIETVAGVDIDESTAMSISTVFACVAKIGKTEGTLPISVIEKTGPNTRTPVDHPLVDLLTTAANDDATGLTARESASANRELWGNATYFVDWTGPRGSREPSRLTHLPARDMEAKRDDDGNLFWWHTPGGGPGEAIPADRIWHTPGLSLGGTIGLSTVSYNRELCGMTKAAQQFKAAFFGNGAWPGGFITRDHDAPVLPPEKARRFLESLNEKFRGSAKAFGFALLRENMQFKQIELPFKDLAWLDIEKPSRIAICGWFDVPPIMIGDDEHSSFHNSEQADIAFAKHSIMPRCLRVEMSARKMFFQGTKLYLKHNLAGVVRADYRTQMQAFALGRQWGILSINDCRALLDMNPIPGGDEYLSPLNMVPVGTQRPTIVPPGDEARVTQIRVPALPSPNTPDAALATLRPAIEKAAERIVRRQCKAVAAAWKKHAKGGREDTFTEWANKWFGEHAESVQAEAAPVLTGYVMATGRAVDVTGFVLAADYCEACLASLNAATRDPDGVPKLIDDWNENMAASIVERLTDVMTKEAQNANAQ